MTYLPFVKDALAVVGAGAILWTLFRYVMMLASRVDERRAAEQESASQLSDILDDLQARIKNLESRRPDETVQ